MKIFVFFFLSIFAALSTANAQEKPRIQIGLSNEVIEISSNFNGTDLVIFGSIENSDLTALKNQEYDVVVALAGPKEIITVRRKERKAGVWVNGTAHNFIDVPSSYSVATTAPLSDITTAENAKLLQIGLQNLSVVAEDDAIEEEELLSFRTSLSRLKVNKNLYHERIGGVEFLSPTLFKAKLALPANVPIGQHTARAFLFKKGTFINSEFSEMTVKKIGFEQFTYNLAHQHGLLFGIIAVLIAIATGWLASVVFQKD